MNNFIHNLITEFKFLYPCIAYEESHSDTEITIITKTKLSRIYPIKKRVQGMEALGEDFWGRYTFKDENNQYFCELDGELYFKGNDMEGEPHYPVKELIHYDFPNIDDDLVEFQPLIEKAKAYIEKNDMELLDLKSSLQLDESNMLESKIICSYKIKY